MPGSAHQRPDNEKFNRDRDDKKRKRELPQCLNKSCPERHDISDCRTTPKDQKKKLIEEYKRSKRRKTTGNKDGKPEREKRLSALADVETKGNSSMFSASLADGAVEHVVLADQGSDANIMPLSILDNLLISTPNLKVSQLQPPHVFKSVTNGNLVCNKSTIADVRLRIRHGSSLLLRGVAWEISTIDLPYLILGRHTLSQIGCDNETMLAAACDKNDGIISVTDDGNPVDMASKAGRVSSLQSDIFQTLHSNAGAEYDGTDDSMYIDLGKDSEEDVEASLDSSVQRAMDIGLSKRGALHLRRLLSKYRTIFD